MFRKNIEKEFMEVFLQTRSRPLGNQQDAFNWIMGKISYFKEKRLEQNKLYALEVNVLRYLTDCYCNCFDEFRRVVDDVAPIIILCEELLSCGETDQAKIIAEPYIRYVVSIKDEYVGKQICYQNRQEAFLLHEKFSTMTNMPQTKDNYTYLFVLYCRILDNILVKTDLELKERKLEKYNLLNIAKEISPWNATVWEGLSRVVDSEKEYMDCISRALDFSVRDGEPYGLGTVYANLALHFADLNPQLAQALCLIAKKYNGNALGAVFVLSKTDVSEIVNEKQAIDVLREAGIQVGYSDVVKKMHLMGI